MSAHSIARSSGVHQAMDIRVFFQRRCIKMPDDADLRSHEPHPNDSAVGWSRFNSGQVRLCINGDDQLLKRDTCRITCQVTQQIAPNAAWVYFKQSWSASTDAYVKVHR